MNTQATPAYPIPDHLVDVLHLRPFDHRTRAHVPGKLVGFWRSHADWRHPLACGVYQGEVERAREQLAGTRRDTRYLSADALALAPYGGSRRAFHEAALARDEAKAQAHASLPWPGDHLNLCMSSAEREAIASLLDSAPIVASYRGYSNDRLNLEARTPNGTGERAAAGWIWPEGLSHYVRTYGLVLPPEMISDLRAQDSGST